MRCKLEGWLSHKAAWPQPAGCGKGWDRDEMHGGARRQSINHSLVRQRVMSRYSFFSVPFAFTLGGKKEIKKKKNKLKMLEGVSEVANLVCHPMRALLS